jgi:gamma-glutamyltranspeptidase/glutathione hydrolase
MLSLPRLCALILALAVSACAIGSARAQGRGEAMAVAANPYAVEAALEILRAGGSAVDAAIAAEMVLGLVEPQSSGIGGGGFLLHYDGASERIRAYDGREWAPRGATPDMFLNAAGEPLPFFEAQTSGRAIGTPLLVAMLKLAHDDHGRLPWAQLFEPATRLADEGFVVSPRLAGFLSAYATRGRLSIDANASAYFYADGAPLPAGTLLRNPEYAATLRAIASEGPRALSHGPIAEAIVASAQSEPLAGTLSLVDLRDARPRRLSPVCGAFRVYRVCTMPSPSSSNATIAILGLYERARPDPIGPDDPDDWAAFLWASRLAYADRDHYMADDLFVRAPTRELIAPRYLDERARLIDLAHAPPQQVRPGRPAGEHLYNRWGNDFGDDAGTTHVVIVDAYGDAVSLTATIESPFGSQRMVHGFLLNNQITDFSFAPTLNGRPVANAIAPRKRPRSSMSPLIVTDADGDLVLLNGSAGGSSIIGYVARTTIAVLDWGQSPEDALAGANAVARFAPLNVESQRLPPGVADALTARGWTMRDFGAAEVSGLTMIHVSPEGLEGAADPRREGVVGRLPAMVSAQ